jgi:hypothetical protein
MPLSNYAKDRFIAPEMSNFTVASIRDMTEQETKQASYTGAYILSTMFRGRFSAPVHQQLFNFLRRSHTAIRAYSSARASTLRYLDDPNHVLQYVDAIGHWETFIGCSWQAFRFLSRGQKIMYTPGDGSWAERLNLLHNAAKHAEERIERGEFIDEAPLSVWLTNDGLRNVDVVLSFDELATVAETLAEWADVAQDPATMEEKIRERHAEAQSGDDPSPPPAVPIGDHEQ